MHLHRFEMRGRECVLSREGGLFFETSARKELIGSIQTPRVVRLRVRRDWPAPGRKAILADGGRGGSMGQARSRYVGLEARSEKDRQQRLSLTRCRRPYFSTQDVTQAGKYHV